MYYVLVFLDKADGGRFVEVVEGFLGDFEVIFGGDRVREGGADGNIFFECYVFSCDSLYIVRDKYFVNLLRFILKIRDYIFFLKRGEIKPREIKIF